MRATEKSSEVVNTSTDSPTVLLALHRVGTRLPTDSGLRCYVGNDHCSTLRDDEVMPPSCTAGRRSDTREIQRWDCPRNALLRRIERMPGLLVNLLDDGAITRPTSVDCRGLPARVAAGRAAYLAHLIRQRSVVQVHLGPPKNVCLNQTSKHDPQVCSTPSSIRIMPRSLTRRPVRVV